MTTPEETTQELIATQSLQQDMLNAYMCGLNRLMELTESRSLDGKTTIKVSLVQNSIDAIRKNVIDARDNEGADRFNRGPNGERASIVGKPPSGKTYKRSVNNTVQFQTIRQWFDDKAIKYPDLTKKGFNWYLDHYYESWFNKTFPTYGEMAFTLGDVHELVNTWILRGVEFERIPYFLAAGQRCQRWVLPDVEGIMTQEYWKERADE